MRDLPRVSDIKFHVANHEHRMGGVLGWVTAEIDNVRVDGITLRRALDGHFVLGFPERVADDGTRFPTVRPRGQLERDAITSAIVRHVAARGWI
jgi:hypothetical protein